VWILSDFNTEVSYLQMPKMRSNRADGKRGRVMTNEEAKVFLDNLKICINEHPIVADWLVEIENRKTENSSEKPNNCDDLQEEQL